MRIACIIIAHKEPRQIERLIKKFLPLPYDFYIHIDKKISQDSFDFLAGLPHVHFVKNRIRVRWASYSFLLAVFQTMKEIFESGNQYNFISLMSGQDYPIKPVINIFNTLEKNPGKNFICYEEGDEWWSHALSRIHKYHFTNFSFRGRYRIQFFLNALLPRRKFPLPHKLYGGPRAMCMTLSVDCAAFILKFFESNKKLRRFVRFTWGPDEFLIPTIIMNSEFRDSVVNDNFYYIDWSQGGVNPKTFTLEDFDALISSDKLLARKFDIEKDTEILNRLDRFVDR